MGEARVIVSETADRMCGKRLKAILPALIGALEEYGPIAIDATVGQRLLAASATSAGWPLGWSVRTSRGWAS